MLSQLVFLLAFCSASHTAASNMSLKAILNDDPSPPLHALGPSASSSSGPSLDPLPTPVVPPSPSSVHHYSDQQHWPLGSPSVPTKQHRQSRHSTRHDAAPVHYNEHHPRHDLPNTDNGEYRGRSSRARGTPNWKPNGSDGEEDGTIQTRRKRKLSPEADDDYRPPAVKVRVCISKLPLPSHP